MHLSEIDPGGAMRGFIKDLRDPFQKGVILPSYRIEGEGLEHVGGFFNLPVRAESPRGPLVYIVANPDGLHVQRVNRHAQVVRELRVFENDGSVFLEPTSRVHDQQDGSSLARLLGSLRSPKDRALVLFSLINALGSGIGLARESNTLYTAQH